MKFNQQILQEEEPSYQNYILMIKRENLKRDAFVIGKTDKYLNNRLFNMIN